MSDHVSGNLLLGTLDSATLRGLHIHEEDHAIAAVLITADETPAFVFFPHTAAVVSIVRSTEDGFMVESGVIGSEGMFNLQTAITEPAPTGSQAVVQGEGRFSRIEARLLREHFREDAPFRDRILAFTSLFLGQVTQNLVCNRLHPIEQRLAKWMLIIRDRTDNDELHLTQDFLAHMLGIHRPGVSIAVTALEIDGLVSHARNRLAIRDREGLLVRSCECYAVIHAGLAGFRSTFPN
jgi:CRP-like cAMP-binding protein